jgi:hypothetical protein
LPEPASSLDQDADLMGERHRATRRRENEHKTAVDAPPTDAQGLVELGCECIKEDCERSVRVPLYVYRRVLASDEQYLVHRGHHPFARYRTVVTTGAMSIEELARDREDG